MHEFDGPSDLPVDLLESARAAFAARFGRAATIAAIAPGRVNLIGEHTDYNYGFVLPMAIDRWTIALAAAAPPGEPSRLWAMDFDEFVTANLLQKDIYPPLPLPQFVFGEYQPRHAHASRFAKYIASCHGNVRMRHRGLPNVDLAVTSTIPMGGGLSSSAALLVAVTLLFDPPDEDVDEAVTRAMWCQMIERHCGTPCGIMDPLIIGIARKDCAMLIDCAAPGVFNAIPLPDDLSILIAETGVRRALASSEYALRRETCETAAKKLGVESLREATSDMVRESATLTEVERRRALHVVQENARTRRAAIAMKRRDLDALGDLLFAGHDSLRDLYEVSCPELDRIVDAARVLRDEGAGVIGARMTGGGFGGCAVILCDRARERAVIDRLRPHAAHVWPARAVDGAQRIALDS